MGKLRSSFRAVGKAPYDVIGLPWHPCRESDVVPGSFAGGPIELLIDMKPTSYVFQGGQTHSARHYVFTQPLSVLS